MLATALDLRADELINATGGAPLSASLLFDAAAHREEATRATTDAQVARQQSENLDFELRRARASEAAGREEAAATGVRLGRAEAAVMEGAAALRVEQAVRGRASAMR